jgi:hypothetical protein
MCLTRAKDDVSSQYCSTNPDKIGNITRANDPMSANCP